MVALHESRDQVVAGVPRCARVEADAGKSGRPLANRQSGSAAWTRGCGLPAETGQGSARSCPPRTSFMPILEDARIQADNALAPSAESETVSGDLPWVPTPDDASGTT